MATSECFWSSSSQMPVCSAHETCRNLSMLLFNTPQPRQSLHDSLASSMPPPGHPVHPWVTMAEKDTISAHRSPHSAGSVTALEFWQL